MADVSVQPYSAIYHEQVVTLILNIQRNEFGVPITREQQPDLNTIEEFYQQGNGNFWVALYQNDVIGTIALIDIGNNQLALRKMFVHEAFRGGVYQTGQRLLDTAIAWIREKNCSEVYLGTLEIFKAAQRFYEKNGFEEIAKSELPNTFPKMALDNKFYKKTIVSDVAILNYETIHQPWFEKFNRDWIEQYFWMEPLDFEVLQHPDEHIIKEGGTILMAAVGKEIAGTVALKYVSPGVFEFTKMAVEERFRGKKVGKILAEAAIRKARSLQADKIILYSNTVLEPAIALYRKLGFKEIPVDGPYKRSNIKMELVLRANNTTQNNGR